MLNIQKKLSKIVLFILIFSIIIGNNTFSQTPIIKTKPSVQKKILKKKDKITKTNKNENHSSTKIKTTKLKIIPKKQLIKSKPKTEAKPGIETKENPKVIKKTENVKIIDSLPVKDEPVKKIGPEYLDSYIEQLETSFDLFQLIITNECGENCNNEKKTEIAKSILENINKKHPNSKNTLSADELKFLLANSNILKNKKFTKIVESIQAKNNIEDIYSLKVDNKVQEPDISSKPDNNVVIENTIPVVTYITKTPDLLSSVLSPDKSKAVFVSERDGNPEIYVMNNDGSNQVRLTNNEDYDLMPVWSPDSSKIAFISERDGNSEVYTMNSDGSNQIRLTNNNSYDYSPGCSPDGTKIIFVSNRNLLYEKDGLFKISYRIYIMDIDGSNQTLISPDSIEDESPKWSPDGKKIAFVSNRDGNSEIYIMNYDGTNIKRLTDNNAADLMPNWSPDSTRLTFRSDRDGNPEIYVMNADGTNQLRLTNNKVADEYPCWTSDGTKITYVSKRDRSLDESGSPTYEIYTMSPDGSNIDRLTRNDFNDYFPNWSKT